MQILYKNGKVLTMEAQKPVAEAVLIQDGVIKGVGKTVELERLIGSEGEQVDLHGRTLMPAFIDAHSHFAAMANGLLQVSLEESLSFEQIGQKIQEFIKTQSLQPGRWIFAKGYDHNRLAEKRHPNRWELDRWAPNNPLVLQHQSGHVGVFNSAALQLLGINGTTQEPVGGRIEKLEGEPTGYMEENAFIQYLQHAPMPDIESLMRAFEMAQQRYASYGITTMQEGMLAAQLIPLYQQLLERKLLKLDLVGYAGVEDYAAAAKAFPRSIGSYDRHFRLGGYKIFLDGSPQGRTAWMRKPYLGEPAEYCGYGTMQDAEVSAAIKRALNDKTQILAHCNGDAACAQYIREIAKVYQEDASITQMRPVMIHAQFLGLDQMEEVKRYGMIPSFFIAHIYHWGDIHIQNFGKERADNISPAMAAQQKGIPFTFHQDAPVIQPNMMETIWCAVNRKTRGGVQLGETQRISVADALKAVTLHAAYQYGEEAKKGSIAPGKLADFVLLEENPLETAEEKLKQIKVLQTIFRGKTIYIR